MTATANLVTSAYVAKVLGVTQRTVRRMADDGRLPYVQKVPGQTGAYLFDAETVEQVFEQTQARA